ncbi:type II toxin-antitoxin system Phd/YefM family antitoxin [Streptomyces liangshanensis]|uniref:Antitoxin n=1 Tax=Streptomyces liangshanensis TaxID=2717324 RepID=A0A6G9GY72_9ACTN|nr:type II toxin-antitoxin system Phd/YefM family antitoxin [Streptomyces liangshanensis]QIQ03006.1 type II toxin-antitoxin system Phd/YefM family antitoxin [Streptomyces liangshanensis]
MTAPVGRTDTYALTEARTNFGALVRRVALAHDRIVVTDRGHVSAVLVNPQDLADLEDSLAIAEYRQSVADGTARFVTHQDLKRQLGLTD